jgi:hypothetical protein
MVLFFALFVAIFARVSAWERDPVASRVRLVSQQSADKIEAGLDEQAAFLDQPSALLPVLRRSRGKSSAVWSSD